MVYFFFFQAEDGIRDVAVTGVQTCALPIYGGRVPVRERGEAEAEVGERGRDRRRQVLGRGLRVGRDRVDQVEAAELRQLDQRLGALAERLHDAREPGAVRWDGEAGALEEGRHEVGQRRRRGRLHVLEIHPLELLGVKDSRRLADVL